MTFIRHSDSDDFFNFLKYAVVGIVILIAAIKAAMSNQNSSDVSLRNSIPEPEVIPEVSDATRQAGNAISISLGEHEQSGVDAATAINQIVPEGNEGLQYGLEEYLSSVIQGENFPSARQEAIVTAFIKKTNLDPKTLRSHLWDKFVRLCAMRDLQEGKWPDRLNFSSDLPFNLELDEKVVWAFPQVLYLEDRIVTSRTRVYGGMSIRVAPGLNLYSGQSSPVTVTEGYVPTDHGLLAYTDRALLFQGSHKALRVKYRDIATFQRFDNGVAICKGTQTARNLGFEVPDPLPGFPHGLLQALARLSTTKKLTAKS